MSRILTDKTLWKDPEVYRPERFKDDQLDYPLGFSPFGFAGGRVCPGKSISQLEVCTAIATLFRNFDVKLADDKPLKFKHLTAMSLEEEVYAYFTPRNI